MGYFNPGFTKFFRDLSKNNTTAWFDENRKTYETEVKKPFAAFVETMIKRIQKHEPDVKIKAGDAIMRINKDIRFSKDKTPYNTHVAANISAFGKKDKSWPGFFFQFSNDKILIVGGSYVLENDQLQNLRNYIAGHITEFSAAYNDNAFREKFGAIKGEKNKKLPDEFKAVCDKEPLIANKQFYYETELKPQILTMDNLDDVLMDFYKAGKKVNDFLKKGLKT